MTIFKRCQCSNNYEARNSKRAEVSLKSLETIQCIVNEGEDALVTSDNVDELEMNKGCPRLLATELIMLYENFIVYK